MSQPNPAHEALELTAMVNACLNHAAKATKAGSSGKEAYRVLVGELRLNTREHGAALQPLLDFKVTEGTSFPSCLRELKTIVRAARPSGKVVAPFQLVQSTISLS